jgi:two-component system response regulator QseB
VRDDDEAIWIEPARQRLLIVEDDRELREMLGRLFTGAGYAVEVAADGQTGLHKALTSSFHGLIIDRGLPAIDGLDLIARLRRQGVDTPMMVLTAYGSAGDVIAGLDSGAEDYVVKPFEVDVLLARVRALLRRQRSRRTTLPLGDGVLDVTSRTVTLGTGAEVELSGRESTLLRVLAAAPNRVFSRDELKVRVFDSAESESIVDTYVHYLRRKLGTDAVSTVRGIGYRAGRV